MISRVAFNGILTLARLTGAAEDILLAHWAKVNRLIWKAAGLSVWGVCLLLFALLMRHGDRSLGVTFTLSAVIHVAIVLGWDLMMGDQGHARAVGRNRLGSGRVLLIEAGQGGE